MQIELCDFNGADEYFTNNGAAEWKEIKGVLGALDLHLQASDQAGRVGSPIFDPKGTNASLNGAVRELGWTCPVAVPDVLTMFGKDWDAGKGGTLAEWQFSNYPFLWNNVIRTQAVLSGKVPLDGVEVVEALLVVTKSGIFPASQSTLYYEQGEAQLEAVMGFEAFDLPIRLVGLTIETGVAAVQAVWSRYSKRYSRVPEVRENTTMDVTWGTRPGQYGTLRAAFSRRP